MDVFATLLHDSPGAGTVPDVDAHRSALARPDGWAVGPLVVGDERLSGLDADVDVSVLTSGGAGSVEALARRASALRLVAVETVLRDLDDLATAAARVVAAASGLPDGVEVFVGLPDGSRLVDAVELVEAAGLQGRLDLAPRRGVAEQMSVLVEADLPFKVTGAGDDALGPYGVIALLMAVEALVDGADPQDAEQLLAHPDETRSRLALSTWDEPQQARVRRRLRGVDSPDVVNVLERLGGAGLL